MTVNITGLMSPRPTAPKRIPRRSRRTRPGLRARQNRTGAVRPNTAAPIGRRRASPAPEGRPRPRPHPRLRRRRCQRPSPSPDQTPTPTPGRIPRQQAATAPQGPFPAPTGLSPDAGTPKPPANRLSAQPARQRRGTRRTHADQPPTAPPGPHTAVFPLQGTPSTTPRRPPPPESGLRARHPARPARPPPEPAGQPTASARAAPPAGRPGPATRCRTSSAWSTTAPTSSSARPTAPSTPPEPRTNDPSGAAGSPEGPQSTSSDSTPAPAASSPSFPPPSPAPSSTSTRAPSCPSSPTTPPRFLSRSQKPGRAHAWYHGSCTPARHGSYACADPDCPARPGDFSYHSEFHDDVHSEYHVET